MNQNVLEAAADWYIRVRSAELSADEHVAWLNWIEADPAHRQSFNEIQKAWDVSGGLQIKPFQKPRPVWRSRLALAASALLALGVSLWLVKLASNTNERFATGRGEQQAAFLPDGSRVELGAQTSVTVSYTATQRLLVADEGEAFYKVMRDISRPFVVRAGPVHVTALGTAFSIRREGESVAVVVSEGLVEVRATNGDAPAVRAGAGERIRFEGGALERGGEQVTTELATTWRRGRLRFEEEPLRVVAANLNRYSQRKIEIVDPELAEYRFTGTVFDDRVEDWLNGVQVVFPVRVRAVDDNHVRIERAQ